MGQKVHPKANRIGIIRSWDGRWFAKSQYRQMLREDIIIRRMIKERCYSAGVSSIQIEKTASAIQITTYCARPGIIIGRAGQGVERLKADIEKQLSKASDTAGARQVSISVQEVAQPDLDAQLVSEGIASQLERRVAYRRALKQAIARSMRAGALGVRVATGGRLVGAEMARRDGYLEGKVPLHTFMADIDYGFAEAHTKYGQIGIKVWIHRRPQAPDGAAS